MTAEIILVMRDDKRIYLRKAIPSETKKQVDRTVEEFTKWAKERLLNKKRGMQEGELD